MSAERSTVATEGILGIFYPFGSELKRLLGLYPDICGTIRAERYPENPASGLLYGHKLQL